MEGIWMKKNNKIKKLLIIMAAALACSTGVTAKIHAVQMVPMIDGYVAAYPDSSNEGFKVELEQNNFSATTDAKGYFKLDTGDRIHLYQIINFKISKKGYLSRYIRNNAQVIDNVTVGTKDNPVSLCAGDVNGDDAINMNDVVLIAKSFNTTSNENGFNDAADVNFDKSINMSDVVIIAKNFNKSSRDYPIPAITGVQFPVPESIPSSTPTPTRGPTNTPLPTDTPTNTPTNTPINPTDTPSKQTNTPTPYVTDKPSSQASATSVPLVNSKNLKATSITFNSEEKIVDGKNLVFCPTFQMAWDSLSGLVGEKIALSGDPEPVDILNKGYSMANSLSPDSYYTKAGYGQNTVDTINKELKERFSEPPSLNLNLQPSDMIAYAYLFKTLSFAKAFDVMKEPLKFNGKENGAVKAFGINAFSPKFEELKKQIKLYSFSNNDDFIVKLLGQSEKDEIILAKVPKEETLYKTYTTVMNRINGSKPDYFDPRDNLTIPVLNFNVGHNFTQLEGREFTNPNSLGYAIETAYQRITFRLDETGASLASEALIVAPIVMYQPKELVFDSPFILIMKEKDAQNPYLIMWIDNTELLQAY